MFATLEDKTMGSGEMKRLIAAGAVLAGRATSHLDMLTNTLVRAKIARHSRDIHTQTYASTYRYSDLCYSVPQSAITTVASGFLGAVSEHKPTEIRCSRITRSMNQLPLWP